MIYPEKLKNESEACYRLFKHYLDLGNKRTIEKLAYETKKSDTNIKDFFRIFNWEKRIEEFNKLNPNQRFSKKLESKINENPKNVGILLDIQQKLNDCMNYINKNVTPDNLISEEDDEDTKMNKILKFFKIMETYLRIFEKTDSQLNFYFDSNLDIPKSEDISSYNDGNKEKNKINKEFDLEVSSSEKESKELKNPIKYSKSELNENTDTINTSELGDLNLVGDNDKESLIATASGTYMQGTDAK